MGPAQVQCPAAVAVGEQSEVADLDEAGRQDMEQEAADELDRIEVHAAAAVAMTGVSPAKADLSVLEADESSVGDGDPMGVSGQIFQNMLGSAKRRLGIDHPLSSSEASEQRIEGARC